MTEEQLAEFWETFTVVADEIVRVTTLLHPDIQFDRDDIAIDGDGCIELHYYQAGWDHKSTQYVPSNALFDEQWENKYRAQKAAEDKAAQEKLAAKRKAEEEARNKKVELERAKRRVLFEELKLEFEGEKHE